MVWSTNRLKPTGGDRSRSPPSVDLDRCLSGPSRPDLDRSSTRLAPPERERQVSVSRRGVRCGNRLRLRRSTLPQENPKHDQDRDGKELALPVLKALVPEFRINERLQHRPRLLVQFVQETPPPCDGLP